MSEAACEEEDPPAVHVPVWGLDLGVVWHHILYLLKIRCMAGTADMCLLCIADICLLCVAHTCLRSIAHMRVLCIADICLPSIADIHLLCIACTADMHLCACCTRYCSCTKGVCSLHGSLQRMRSCENTQQSSSHMCVGFLPRLEASVGN